MLEQCPSDLIVPVNGEKGQREASPSLAKAEVSPELEGQRTWSGDGYKRGRS